MISVIDLFCGAGGLTHGFVRAGGFNIVAGIDVDKTCKYPYETNNPGSKFLEWDLGALKASELIPLFPTGDIKVLVGCAPCQPFSRYSNPNKEAAKKGGRWNLLYRFADFVKEVQPEIVSMENVPDLSKHKVFLDFVQVLEKEKYSVWAKWVDCVQYGIPQTRTRLVLMASKYGAIEIIPPTHTPETYCSVDQTIGHLPAINAGGVSTTDPLHRASNLSPLNLRRIKASKQGGSWNDWPDDLKLACHKKESGESFGSVYGRMTAGKPSPTMTTECNGIGNGRFGHPTQHRAISVREAALFQTFPESYDFIDPKIGFNFTVLTRHIGNAVPVRLGEVIAGSIKRHLEIHDARSLDARATIPRDVAHATEEHKY